MNKQPNEVLESIRRSWDATSDSYCDLGPTFLLCEETGEMAVNGACPVHGGDACMFVYGKVLLLDANRNPALAAAFRRSNPEAAAERARHRAAELQEQLGFTVQAATSNDWLGAYAIVDFDSLDALAAALHRERQERQRIADLADDYERQAEAADTRAQPANASSLEDQVEERQTAKRLRYQAAELRAALAASSAADGPLTPEQERLLDETITKTERTIAEAEDFLHSAADGTET